MNYVVKVMRWDESASADSIAFTVKEHAYSVYRALFDVAVHNADGIRAVALTACDGTDPDGEIIEWTFF